MDFGYSDDQRDIQRTARDLLTERARPERVRELAEAGRSDDELWRELSQLGWLGIAIAGLAILAAMLSIPGYPLWSLTQVALAVLVIYGLAAYGGIDRR